MKAFKIMRENTLSLPSIITFLFLSAFFLSGINEASAQSTNHLLDGLSFSGAMGEAGSQEAKWNEEITFQNGKMHSSACAPSGFKNGEYQTVKKGDVITFTAKCHSESEGDLDWTGTVKNGVLEASYVWRKGDDKWNYWIKCKKDEK